MTISYLKPFADWLSISYPTSLSPHLDIVSLFTTISPLDYTDLGGAKELYKSTSGGSLFITSKDSYVNLSISGLLLSQARDSEHYRTFLELLASAPYNITRLDVAYDTPLAGPLSIQRIRGIYPTGHAQVATRQRQLQYILNQLNDGTDTGTVYFQNNKYKGTIKLRVYDKAHQMIQEHSTAINPTTRYELSVCRGASLSDFENPASVFWHFLPSDLLDAPEGFTASKWTAAERINYDDYSKGQITDYERLKFLIENHPALLQIVRQSLNVPGGDLLLRRQIEKMFVTCEAYSEA